MNITKTPAILKRNPLSRKEKNVMKVVFMSAYLPAKACGTVWGLGFGVWGLGFGVWEYFSFFHAGRGVSRRPAEIPNI
ncbi:MULTISPECIES: hypothetical protein [Klebsiella]|uniref:hypothetical protein n=1 Tax=Klebsiella TaxID=570 RepID=UPI00287752CE|nr:hypothetical protein [Klebsiella pasteurii]WND09652.1 hypothetical protein RIV03_25095 [Klebsiella pasteurii]